MAEQKPSMRFIATTAEKLESIEVKSGQLIFVQDDRATYLDNKGVRVPYKTIITVVDEATRQAIESPLTGFYYVRLSNTLWSYENNQWTQITGGDVERNVIFADGNLPETGKEDTIYVHNEDMYRWSDESKEYTMVGGNQWSSIK